MSRLYFYSETSDDFYVVVSTFHTNFLVSYLIEKAYLINSIVKSVFDYREISKNDFLPMFFEEKVKLAGVFLSYLSRKTLSHSQCRSLITNDIMRHNSFFVRKLKLNNTESLEELEHKFKFIVLKDRKTVFSFETISICLKCFREHKAAFLINECQVEAKHKT